jgi:hypothetical protein
MESHASLVELAASRKLPTRCRQVNEFGLSGMVNADHVDFL